MNFLANLSIIPVGIAVSAIGILGFVIFFNNRNSITNRTFLWFSLIAILWNTTSYLSYQFTSTVLILWLLRIQLFFAVWYCFFLFRFFYVFPNEKIIFSKIHKFIIIPFVALTSLVTLSPLAITEVNRASNQGKSGDVIGLGMILFGVTVVSLIASGIVVFFEKRKRKKGKERTPYNYILIGTIITFSLYIVFNFVFPVFLQNVRYISYGAIFSFPFIAFTSYAIIRHRFLDVKVISTEILVFVLSAVTLIEILTSQSIPVVLVRILEFFLVLVIGILLIRSVVREVKQREQLEILDKQLEAANQQLKILDQARAEFITIASHQLRTPPATIKWYLAAILDGDYGKFDESVKQELRKTASTNNSMIALIDDLLNASRIERGKMEFVFVPTNLTEITQITVDQLLPQAEMRKLKLVFEKPKVDLPIISADKEKLRQVINNLIDNAIKYTTEGTIEVTLSQTKTDVILKVTDSGRGVAPGQLGEIFKKYERGASPARNSSGLGLGLYVAKVIIDQHKGKIWVESKGEGKGSSFIFSLPIKAQLTDSEFDLAKGQATPPGKT
ncbi:MAG: ATP-binding protein [Candidatus Doudnabacteria bacterium]